MGKCVNRLMISEIISCKSLLNKIGSHMCFNREEVDTISNDVIAFAIRQGKSRENDLPIKIWLSQLMVRKCYHSISAKLFSETDARGNIKPPTPQNIPISLWLVFTLHTSVGFNIFDIADILSSTPGQITDKLNRAKAILFNSTSKN